MPALVLLARLPIHRAVGTSLMIIALNSWTGFLGYLDVLAELHLALDARVIVLFIAIGSLGSLLGHGSTRACRSSGCGASSPSPCSRSRA